MKELRAKPERAFELIADFLKAARTVMERVWGNNDRYKFTTSVSIKAMIRVLGDLMESSDTIERWQENPGPRVFEKRISDWASLQDEFRSEGFYERFPAKGQIERVPRDRAAAAARNPGPAAIRQTRELRPKLLFANPEQRHTINFDPTIRPNRLRDTAKGRPR